MSTHHSPVFTGLRKNLSMWSINLWIWEGHKTISQLHLKTSFLHTKRHDCLRKKTEYKSDILWVQNAGNAFYIFRMINMMAHGFKLTLLRMPITSFFAPCPRKLGVSENSNGRCLGLFDFVEIHKTSLYNQVMLSFQERTQNVYRLMLTKTHAVKQNNDLTSGKML